MIFCGKAQFSERTTFMNEKLKSADVNNLFHAILSLKDLNECYDLFEDLCTVAEIKEMAKRFRAAKMLSDGAKYTEISESTGLSTATISRVNRALKYGTDGYMKLLARIDYED